MAPRLTFHPSGLIISSTVSPASHSLSLGRIFSEPWPTPESPLTPSLTPSSRQFPGLNFPVLHSSPQRSISYPDLKALVVLGTKLGLSTCPPRKLPQACPGCAGVCMRVCVGRGGGEGDSRGGEAETLLQGAPSSFMFLHLFRTSQGTVKHLVGGGLSEQLDSGFPLPPERGYVLPLSHTLHLASLRLSANFSVHLSNPGSLVKHIRPLTPELLLPFPISSQPRLPLMDILVP